MIQTIIIIGAALFALMIIGVLVGLIVAVKRSTPTGKGDFGENAVAKALGGTVQGKQYLINDLLFEISGHSCQIDHVFINRNGIWVIETKNYAGTIYGEDSYREWKQVLGDGSTVNPFYNPVKQNKTHIYRLKEYLNADIYLLSAVVFLDNADITNVKSDCTFSINELQTIKERDTGIILSAEQMEYYYQKLLELKTGSTVTKQEHIENIHEMQYNVQHGICPHCKVRLVLRNGRNGKFYGCPNYPKCNFTMNL
ncbi:MAG: NERD domain-containing protein [Clostridia bacterium]|nr:NERD domain-containing protein [Clostridia bacterium]